MHSVLIVDDHAVVRRGLKQILADALVGSTIDEAGNAEEALGKVLKKSYDLVVLDISLPGRSGLEVLRDIKYQQPGLPVLVLSVHPEDQMGIRILKAGASGYLNKDSAPEDLVKAVTKVLEGGRYVSPTLAERLVLDIQTDSGKPPHETLSDREFEVLCAIARGKAVSEIARDLSLSVKTVSTYRTRILEKMQMKTNAELTHYAVRQGLVD
ncbi:MAG: response regulator transcription factor [Chthonomonadales bacterium]|nr:response regulator transcription factor [Chthonomonadales bacterium]